MYYFSFFLGISLLEPSPVLLLSPLVVHQSPKHLFTWISIHYFSKNTLYLFLFESCPFNSKFVHIIFCLFSFWMVNILWQLSKKGYREINVLRLHRNENLIPSLLVDSLCGYWSVGCNLNFSTYWESIFHYILHIIFAFGKFSTTLISNSLYVTPSAPFQSSAEDTFTVLWKSIWMNCDVCFYLWLLGFLI